jgi:hypothetical protein
MKRDFSNHLQRVQNLVHYRKGQMYGWNKVGIIDNMTTISLHPVCQSWQTTLLMDLAYTVDLSRSLLPWCRPKGHNLRSFPTRPILQANGLALFHFIKLFSDFRRCPSEGLLAPTTFQGKVEVDSDAL